MGARVVPRAGAAGSRTVLEGLAREGESPVDDTGELGVMWFVSTTLHVKWGGNPGGPPPKARVPSATDREVVP